MAFLLIARDKPDSLALRLANREAHLAYLRSLDCLQLAGPTLDEDGKPDGSMLLFTCKTMEEAEAIADNDPYTKAGLFAHVAIAPWRQVLPEPHA